MNSFGSVVGRAFVVEDHAFGYRTVALRREPNLECRTGGRGHVEHHRWVAAGRDGVSERVGAKGRRAAAGRSDHRDGVGAGEADQTGLCRHPGVEPGDDELRVADAGDRHALALAGALDAPSHRPHRPDHVTVIPLEEQRSLRLPQHPDAGPRVHAATAVGIR